MASRKVELISEEFLPYFGFRGHVHLIEGPSTDDYPAGNPIDLIQTDQSFKLVFHWETKGKLNHIICGKWKLELLLEQMGKKEFYLDPSLAVETVHFVSKPTSYDGVIEIPPHTVEPGVYRIVATLRMVGQSGVPAPLAAFADLGLVDFYSDGPES